MHLDPRREMRYHPLVEGERVIQVFVGSPGDVAVERDLVFRVIDALNDDEWLPEGWRFEGVGWDKTHYPKIAWLAPQEAIDQGIPGPQGMLRG